MRDRIARVLLCLALLGTPALALAAADACPPCCDHASMGHGEMPCDGTSLRESSCCEAPRVAATEPVKRGIEASAAAPAGVLRPAAPASHPAPVSLASGWWLRPDRLSVVRRL